MTVDLSNEDLTQGGKYLILEEYKVGKVLLGVIRVDKENFALMKSDVLKVKGQKGYDKYLDKLWQANMITTAELEAAKDLGSV